MTEQNNLTLGKKVTYKDQYDPSILFPINRQARRKDYIPMYGTDIWTCFEVSYLLPNGMPRFIVLRIENPADSENIFESKSLKLYLNSFNNTVFDKDEDVITTIKSDLNRLIGGDCKVYQVREFPVEEQFSGEILEDIYNNDIKFTEYNYNPHLLETIPNNDSYDKVITYRSNLLRSNCEITNQPDWGTITISYIPNDVLINPNSLLRYIVSYRRHQEFHEPTCERIFQDLYTVLHPQYLTVLCQYTRRGGIDINPFRSLTPIYGMPVFTKTLHQ